MAIRGVKKKEHERLDDATISRVAHSLDHEKGYTKKKACEDLNISYNVGRLNRIIQEYKDRLEYTRKRYENNKRQPFSELEIQEIVTDYLNGDSVSSIAGALYRSVHTIKTKIRELNLPERSRKPTYQNPDLIPDEAVSEAFEVGELVWSARYNSVAEIRNVWEKDEKVYSIFVFGKHNEFAYQPWWELGKLEVVKRFNLTPEKFIKTEKPNFSYRVDDEGRTIS
jgi:transposase